jgi:two-component system cell cycle sensor histidine kinase/response regulator CckA
MATIICKRGSMKERNGNKILVVDDAKAIRVTLSKILSFMGFEVAVASSGHEGLDLFLKSSFDLVLADLQMPDMDGWTLALHIKDESSDTPIVLVTGEEKGRVMEKLEDSCVDSVVFKPFTLEDIQEAVQEMLDKTAL